MSIATKLGACAALGLLHAPFAGAAIFTVGPGGTHATIQAAVDAALAAPGDDEVRIHAGTYTELLTITNDAGAVDLSGGWDDAYATRGNDPAATVLDAQLMHRVANISVSGGRVSFANFTATLGFDRATGGAIRGYAVGAGELAFTDCVISESALQNATNLMTPALEGGGAYLRASSGGRVTMSRCRVTANRILPRQVTPNPWVPMGYDVAIAQGGGLFVSSSTGQVLIEDVELSDNSIDGVFDSQYSQAAPYGAGLAATGSTGDATFRRLVVRGNSAISLDTAPVAGISMNASSGSTFILDRSRIVDNLGYAGGQPGGRHVLVGGEGTTRISNTLVARSNAATGILLAPTTGLASLVNVTIVDHATSDLSGLGDASLYNAIVGVTDKPGTSNNLLNTDPQFVDRAAGDFRLAAGSPAIDAGTSAPPVDATGTDLDGGPRVSGGAIDIGAFEYVSPMIFSDGFED